MADQLLSNMILSTYVLEKGWEQKRKAVHITGWDKFRSTSTIDGETLTKWTEHLSQHMHTHSRTISTREDTPGIDKPLLHLWEARRGLIRRWKRNKLKRKLKAHIAQITDQAQQYAADFARDNWYKICEQLTGKLAATKLRLCCSLYGNWLRPKKTAPTAEQDS